MRIAILERLAIQRLKQIDSQFKAIEAALAALRDGGTALKARFDILLSIPSTGCPRQRQMARQTLNPRRQGKPATAIYMPALVATRFNPDFKAKYQAMIAAGKPPKVAIVAVMRKLVVLANALLKAGRNWHPKAA